MSKLFILLAAALIAPARASTAEDSDSDPEVVARVGSTILETIASELGTALDDEVCYDDDDLGCFSNTAPWRSLTRPVAAPQPPSEVQTRMCFHSKENVNCSAICLHPEVNIGCNGAKYDSNRKTYIATHGFMAYGGNEWLIELKDALLKYDDVNVIIVDWRKGSQQVDYLQASSNVRIVAREMFRLVKALNINLSTLHCMGHSLGAHICGELGRLLEGKIARITGMDVAQPGFEEYDPLVHLDKTDAQFVDSVHTSARPFFPFAGFGFMMPVGHSALYANGGAFQPACIANLDSQDIRLLQSYQGAYKFPSAVSETTVCDHSRSFKYYVEALANPSCVFWGRPMTNTTSQDNAENNLTGGFEADKIVAKYPPCNMTTCVPLGLRTPDSPLRGVFYIVTHGISPFCVSEPVI